MLDLTKYDDFSPAARFAAIFRDKPEGIDQGLFIQSFKDWVISIIPQMSRQELMSLADYLEANFF